MIGANADIAAGMEFGAALTHDDHAADDLLAAEFLDAETAPVRNRGRCATNRLPSYEPCHPLQIQRGALAKALISRVYNSNFRPREPSARVMASAACGRLRRGERRAASAGLAPSVRICLILTIVRSCLWPRLRLEFLRRRFLNAMTLGPRVCSTISPTTLAPATCGAPISAGLAVEQRENLRESHLRPGFAFKRHDGNLVVGGDLILLAAGLDDCEHRFLRVQPGSAREPARPASLQWEPAGFCPASPRPRKSKSAARSRA